MGRTAERMSMNRELAQIPSLKPEKMELVTHLDSPSPTASTACSSGCTSEEDESPKSESRELNTDARSEDEVSPKSCSRHRVTCASEAQESHGTTVMMRNLPFEYTRDNIVELIDRQ